jgi:hypothetical protein
MKTNVVMVRKMQDFDVKQRTSDGMFNSTDLMNQWNNKHNMQKNINHFFELSGTNEFIEVLEMEELNNIRNNERPESQAFIKSKCKTNKDGSKLPGEVWMHPILFIKFAMWLNPRFEYFVIKFVYDELIKFRHYAGDNYIGLTSSISHFENVDYGKLATGLNYIVFGEHFNGIRQQATTEQLRELNALQQQLAFSVRMGYIRTSDQLINEMRRIYDMKYNH